jgi:hypothetical protein
MGRIMVHRRCRHWQHNVALSGHCNRHLRAMSWCRQHKATDGGRLPAAVFLGDALATTFSPRSNHLPTTFSPVDFFVSAASNCQRFPPVSRTKPETNPELTTTHHKPRRPVLSTGKVVHPRLLTLLRRRRPCFPKELEHRSLLPTPCRQASPLQSRQTHAGE